MAEEETQGVPFENAAEGHIGFDVKTANGCGIVVYGEVDDAVPYNIKSIRVFHSTGGNISIAFFESEDRKGNPDVVLDVAPEIFVRIWEALCALTKITMPEARASRPPVGE